MPNTTIASDAPGRQDALPELTPDSVEQDAGAEIDNIAPTYGYAELPMVGLGASAGGITALRTFFVSVPAETGLAFVVVLHLSPEHESLLPQLLSRCTKMPVRAASDGIKVKPNSVYVIPPGKHLTATDGHLRLSTLEHERGTRVAVDYFFRSLADSHGSNAAAIVLSGADGDGAIGIKRIKERGGLTIAQEPSEAECDSMPQASISTGMVDWVLPVAEMAERVIAYFKSTGRLRLPPERGEHPARQTPEETREDEVRLTEVLAFLRTRTGCDFSYYKRATIVRRLARRLQLNGLENLSGYLSFLRTHPGESGALLQDMLISVTNFFRDREAFEKVEALIPELFRGKGLGDSVRVWSPACATGEEPYSLAMLLVEYARSLDQPPSIHVFGCDLNEDAIQVARAGLYPDTIVADVSEDRLKRFFIKEPRGYRMRREVRELVLFANHDLLKDAPFSRMDLIACRNLLIYLSPEAQKKVIETLHFALRPHGLLFLGSSEAVSEGSPLFRVVDDKYRIYRQQPAGTTDLQVPRWPKSQLRSLQVQNEARFSPVLPNLSFNHVAGAPPFGKELAKSQLARSELHIRLLERYAPPSVLVNRDYDIVHLSENVRQFLQLTGGEPTINLLRLVEPGLLLPLRSALLQAAQSGAPVHLSDLPLHSDNVTQALQLRVQPAGDLEPGYLIVQFDLRPVTEGPAGAARLSARNEPSAEPLMTQFERELEVTRGRLRTMEEEHALSTEQMKASFGEVQAMNGELRAASEELETSREELQSINEELSTVNTELKSKLDELSHAHSDLHNLMASTAIATVFLDRELRIKLFTPGAIGLFRVIPSDIGRPLGDLRHQLVYPQMLEDAKRVLDTLIPVERQVQDLTDRSYLARLLPYRTLEDHIGGVVLAFLDITECDKAQKALRHSEERMRLIVQSANDYAIFTTDSDRRINSWNRGAQGIFKFAADEIMGQSADILFTPEDRERGAPQSEAQKAHETGRAENERWHMRKDGSRFYGSGSVVPLCDNDGREQGFVKIMRDLTQRKKAEQELAEKARLLDLSKDAIIVQRQDGTVKLWNKGAEDLFGWRSEEVLGKSLPSLLETEFPKPFEEFAAQLEREGEMSGEFPQRAKDGHRVETLCRWVMDRKTNSILTSYTDISDRKRVEQLTREARERLEGQALELERLVHERTESLQQALFQMEEFSYTVSHDLRAPLRAMHQFAEALLEDHGERLQPEGREYLERIHTAATRMEELTRDVLAYSKVVKEARRPEPVSLQPIVEEILRLSPTLSRSVTIVGTLPVVLGERTLLSQAISNLLNNAAKFSRPGIPVKVQVRHDLKGELVRVWIEDNGIGISPDSQGRLFRLFERVHSGASYEGTGIGLAIVRKAVERMGGHVGVESDGQTGSRFWIELAKP